MQVEFCMLVCSKYKNCIVCEFLYEAILPNYLITDKEEKQCSFMLTALNHLVIIFPLL